MTKQIRTDTSQNITCTIVAKNISNRKWEFKNCPWMFPATCSLDYSLYNSWYIIGSILNLWFNQSYTLFQFSSSKPVSVPGVPYKTISWTFLKLYKRKWHLQIQTLPSYDMQLSGWVWNIDECILAQCTTEEAPQESDRSICQKFLIFGSNSFFFVAELPRLFFLISGRFCWVINKKSLVSVPFGHWKAHTAYV